jgi:hypothetical protein
VTKPEQPERAPTQPLERGRCENVDHAFDGHLETPLIKMTVQQRLDWIDETMRLRTEFRPVKRAGP